MTPDPRRAPTTVTPQLRVLRSENERLRAREAEIAAAIIDGAPDEQAKWDTAVAWTLRHSAHVVECGDCRDLMDKICGERDRARAAIKRAVVRLELVSPLVIGDTRTLTEDGSRQIAQAWEELRAALSPADACRHCGRMPEADGDHSCTCPHPDETCPDHPNEVTE